MEGLVLTLVADAVSRTRGEAEWDAVLADAGAGGAWTAVGTYPDGDLTAVVAAIARRDGTTEIDVLRWAGRALLPGLTARFPELLAERTGTRDFALALDHVIHPAVRRRHPSARTPTFTFDTDDPDVLRMTYRSPRRLCGLAEGLLLGLGDHYGEDVEVHQSRCVHAGAVACVLEVRVA